MPAIGPRAATQALCLGCCRIGDALAGVCARCGSPRLVAHPELPRLAIAHIDCDAFYASVEKRDRPPLANEPLIVGHAGGRGVVLTACYIARGFGVRSAMPMFQALQRCPQAHVIQPDMAKYKRVSDEIRGIFQTATDRIEPLSLDEAYLDLSDPQRDRVPAAEALAGIAVQVEREIGITVSVGLSCNKFLAKLASGRQKPRGFSVIGRDEARDVLAPLSVRDIHGVGAVTARRMEADGLHTIGDLQAMPEAMLIARFGKFGRRLWLYANGNDDRRVIPDQPVKSISAETTFARDTAAAGELRDVASRLSTRVASQLVRKGVAGSSIVLKLKTSDFRLFTRSRRLPHRTQRADVIYQTVAGLIDRAADGRSFRLIGVGVGDIEAAAGADPADLFNFNSPVPPEP